jgi:tripartite-type tricarboxylate transporter receptor subunit TctC
MKQPGESIKIGHPGVGSFGHLADVLAMQELGVKVTQVPYRGAGPALVDLLAGQMDLGPISAVVAGPLVNAGKLKAYVIIGKKRFDGLPGLPTMGELGYKKLEIDFWRMLLAPAGTPRPIIDKFNSALRAALADAKLNKSNNRHQHFDRVGCFIRQPRRWAVPQPTKCGSGYEETKRTRLPPQAPTMRDRKVHPHSCRSGLL